MTPVSMQVWQINRGRIADISNTKEVDFELILVFCDVFIYMDPQVEIIISTGSTR